MEIWLIAAILSASAVAALGWTRQGHSGDGVASRPARLAIYKDQLAALDGDVARGSVTSSEASALRTEVARRMLAVEQESEGTPAQASKLLLWLASLAVPLLALVLYAALGAPTLPGLPQKDRLARAEANNDMAAMIYKVELHLKDHPEDVQGWQLLLPSYGTLGRFGDQAEAYRHLLALQPPTADLYTGLAEALMFQGQGLMPVEGVDAVKKALALQPRDTKARYYEALSLAQDGKKPEALAKFQALLAEAPADAPWRSSVENQITQLGAASRPKALEEQQVKDASQMTSADKQHMIRGMVDGLAQKLAANPQDLSGWLKLIRARTVLGEGDEATKALATARSTFASDAPSLDQVNALAQELNLK
jgi:cytochrome c-type biogenesis protein CcmH